MKTIIAAEPAPSLEAVLADDIVLMAPTKQDLDRAHALMPGLAPDPECPGAYVDQEGIVYFGVPLQVQHPRPTIGNPRPLAQSFWQRFTWVSTGGTYWEPPDVCEQALDEDGVGYPSLSAAVEATRHGLLQRTLDAIDNTCYECYGAGTCCHDETPCHQCGGVGYHPLCKA